VSSSGGSACVGSPWQFPEIYPEIDLSAITSWAELFVSATLPSSTRHVGAWIEQEFGLVYESRSGLFARADCLREFRQGYQTQPKSQEIIYGGFGQADSVDADPDRASNGITNGTEAWPSSAPKSVNPATDR
jgi:hypothetical protein